jgi:hypothetical protein
MRFKKKAFDRKRAKLTIGDRNCATLFPTDEKMEQMENKRI